MKIGAIYYTENCLNLHIAHAVQKQIKKIGIPVVSCSLKPMNFGENVVFRGKRSYLTMFKQILLALETSRADVVFFLEHDVLYSRSHFDFTPPDKTTWFYNVNVWKYNSETGHAVRTDDCRQTSGICVYRETAITHYRKRIEMLENYKGDDFNAYVRATGFEPGTHNRVERVDDAKSATWSSPEPNVDIRHGKNLTATRWRPEEFRNQKFTQGWTETDDIPFWGKISI